MANERGFSTRAVHGVAPPVDQQTPSVPLYQTSTFRFDDSEAYAETIAFRAPGYTYTRGYGNPTVDAFEQQMAALEGTEAAFGFAIVSTWRSDAPGSARRTASRSCGSTRVTSTPLRGSTRVASA